MKIFLPNRLAIAILTIIFSLQLTAQPTKNSLLIGQFKNPPNEYRPITGGLAAAASKDRAKELNKIYTVQGFGGSMFLPTGQAKDRRLQLGVSSSNRHAGNGLAATHPYGESPWIMLSPPGTIPGAKFTVYSSVYNPVVLEGRTASSGGLSAEKTTVATESAAIGYLSQEWFENMKKMLSYGKNKGYKFMFYDEVEYPSGMANSTTPKELSRKLLDKNEEIVTGPGKHQKSLPIDGVLMAVVAMNTVTLERINLMPRVQEGQLNWEVPAGEWKVMVFNCRTALPRGGKIDYSGAIDYMDSEAVNWFIEKVYEPLHRELGEYFGNTIFQSFYDDVGIYNEERTWTYQFNAKFKALTGKDAALYYPALWYHIGPESEAARVAFFDTRSELLADGFPKILTDWGKERNLPVSGHAPGNYEIQPVDMNGDPFKFYRAQPIPMVDVIFNYPFGRDGFKLVSDGADLYDKPIVTAETYPRFVPAGTIEGYRRAMELFIRGINRITAARFIGTRDFGNVDGKIIGDSSTYTKWAGRTSLLMQGGRRISEIAIFYPIAALHAYYRFEAAENTTERRWGTFVPYETDYLAVGEMLLNQVHRDFTFIHPDVLLSDKMKINGNSLYLDNKINHQNYKVLILPGQRVISIKALEKIRDYYEAGGTVVATSLLPSKAAELPENAAEAIENDKKIQSIIKEMFGLDSSHSMPEGVSEIKTNLNKGKSIFIGKPDPDVLGRTLDQLTGRADIVFSDNPTPSGGGGAFSYVHKVKDGLNIYLFANSTDEKVNTWTEVRGKISPEIWNPFNGEISQLEGVSHIERHGQFYTRFQLKLDPVMSVFIVGK